MTDNLIHVALRSLATIANADDMRYLTIYLRDLLTNTRTDHRGLPTSYYDYVRSDELSAAITNIAPLSTPDRQTLAIVVELLANLLQAQTGAARGQVEIKTVGRDYPEIDFETGLPMFDENGDPVFKHFDYHYVYVRLFARRGNADKSTPRYKSHYADRGMGKGGFGGYVAAALSGEFVTKNDILDAWHKGKVAYNEFVDYCQGMVGEPATEDTGNSDQSTLI